MQKKMKTLSGTHARKHTHIHAHTHTHILIKRNPGHVITAKLKINVEHHGLILSKLQSSFTMTARPGGQFSKDP